MLYFAERHLYQYSGKRDSVDKLLHFAQKGYRETKAFVVPGSPLGVKEIVLLIIFCTLFFGSLYIILSEFRKHEKEDKEKAAKEAKEKEEKEKESKKEK
mmetsp:Transcript_29763/g.45115  ORF Transcript_29763/g.45115 Transcript_29763/m.45115 type:complete len:99 (+) Transcript_29763:231-527(+)